MSSQCKPCLLAWCKPHVVLACTYVSSRIQPWALCTEVNPYIQKTTLRVHRQWKIYLAASQKTCEIAVNHVTTCVYLRPRRKPPACRRRRQSHGGHRAVSHPSIHQIDDLQTSQILIHLDTTYVITSLGNLQCSNMNAVELQTFLADSNNNNSQV